MQKNSGVGSLVDGRKAFFLLRLKKEYTIQEKPSRFGDLFQATHSHLDRPLLLLSTIVPINILKADITSYFPGLIVVMSAVNEKAAVPILSAVGEDVNNITTTTENNTAIKSTTDTDTANNNNNIIRRDPQFDHTSRKVVIHNMLKYIRPKEITKLTTQWLSNIPPSEISIVKTKKPPKDSWMKVTLQTEEMVPKFIKLVNEGGVDGKAMENGRGKPLFAKRADEMFTNQEGDDTEMSTNKDDGDNRKRKNNATNNTNKRMRPDNRPPIKILSNDEVRDKITPLWRLSYEEQLNSKAREMVNKCSKKIIKEIKGKFR